MHSHTEETQHYDRGHRVAWKLARGLGWFSIALGAVELLAGRRLSKKLGMRGNQSLLRLYGVRELVTGLGILATRNPAPWIKARVAGDALDMGTLVGYLSPRNRKRDNVKFALGNVVMMTALDVYCARKLGQGSRDQIIHDYSDRRGMPLPPEAMRGAARDFQVPSDMRAPESLRPYPEQGRGKPRAIVQPRPVTEPAV